ncbi:MAG: ABC transporter substrate-binding protein [Flavobacteriaceae bacterium]|nr:ABC transporter substrate-binding protein [Flavobacteriaceae bacterium]
MTKKGFIIIIICVISVWNSYAQQIKAKTEKTIKIGLLISNDESVAARNGAEMAIDIVNKKEGLDGLHFQLVVRSMEGPWGTGSKEAVNLVFNEKVWAIIGSHDGRNAHLVEQVIAKTHIVFLSAWATDPTLYQAFVPWFFSVVPNDLQQADALIEEIVHKRECTKIVTISDKRYDSKLALKSFLEKIKKKGKVEPMQLTYDNTNTSFRDLLDKINKNSSDCIVLFGQPPASLNFIQQLRQNGMDLLVFGNLALLSEDLSGNKDFAKYGNVTIVSFGNWVSSENLSFANSYKEKYGKIPGAVSAYAFDGMNLIIEAVKQSGFDREKIQETMSKIRYKGVTGSIQFDEKGIRIGTAELIEINNGIPITVEK